MKKLFKRLCTPNVLQQVRRQTTSQKQLVAYFSTARNKHNRVKKFKKRKKGTIPIDTAPIYNTLFNNLRLSNNEKRQIAEKYTNKKNLPYQDHNAFAILAVFLEKNITRRNPFFDGDTTLLHRAVFLQNKTLFNMIFTYNDSNIVGINELDPYGDTPLLIAALVHNPIIAAKLIAYNAYVDAKNLQGNTPILNTIKISALSKLESTRDITRLLVDNGANINETDKTGKKPIDYVDAYLKDLEEKQKSTLREEHYEEKLYLQEIKKILE